MLESFRKHLRTTNFIKNKKSDIIDAADNATRSRTSENCVPELAPTVCVNGDVPTETDILPGEMDQLIFDNINIWA